MMLMLFVNRDAADADNFHDAAVSYDGTWMRRGYASLYGAFIAISWDNSNVLDYAVLSLSILPQMYPSPGAALIWQDHTRTTRHCCSCAQLSNEHNQLGTCYGK